MNDDELLDMAERADVLYPRPTKSSMISRSFFIAALMLVGGLLVAGGANAVVTIPSVSLIACGGIIPTPSPISATGNQGEAIRINMGPSCVFGGYQLTSTDTSVVTPAGPIPAAGLVTNFSISPTASPGLHAGVISISNGVTTLLVNLTVIGPAPSPSAVPTLSEWSQMLLGLFVMTLLGWHFHKQRSY